MTRIVLPTRPLNEDTKTAAEGDGYFDRVAKYIPGEIVAAYVLLQGLILSSNSGADVERVLFILAVLGLMILTPFYLKKIAPAGQPWGRQAWISILAFAVWVFALGVVPKAVFGEWIQPWVNAGGSVVLVLFTLAVGAIPPPGQPTANSFNRNAVRDDITRNAPNVKGPEGAA